MQPVKDFVKRNAPVFILGLFITLIFVVIIVAQPKVENNVPAGFIKVEESVFEGGQPKEPQESELRPDEYATQIASPENKGKPYSTAKLIPHYVMRKATPPHRHQIL